MFITSLVLGVCLSAHPDVCKDVTVITSVIDGSLTKESCSAGINAQVMALQWGRENPAWDVKTITCKTVDDKETAL